MVWCEQLIAESYDLLKTVGGLNNDELAAVFTQYNKTELESFLIEITSSTCGQHRTTQHRAGVGDRAHNATSHSLFALPFLFCLLMISHFQEER
jgi:6-phosphogluconate dehydrogenase